jgi:hypothetical protein
MEKEWSESEKSFSVVMLMASALIVADQLRDLAHTALTHAKPESVPTLSAATAYAVQMLMREMQAEGRQFPASFVEATNKMVTSGRLQVATATGKAVA